MQGLSPGRIVHFVMEDGNYPGEHRPAIVVKIWDQSPNGNGCCQLQVFTDGDGGQYNDGLPALIWKTSRINDEAEKKPGTWHWPERA